MLCAQSCLTLCNPLDCSPPGFSVHGDSPGKNTGVGGHFFYRGSSQPRDRTQVSPAFLHWRQILYGWAIREADSARELRNIVSREITRLSLSLERWLQVKGGEWTERREVANALLQGLREEGVGLWDFSGGRRNGETADTWETLMD